MRRRISIKQRIVIYVVLCCFAVFFVLGILGYRSMGRLLSVQCRENALALAKSAAAELNGELFKGIRTKGDSAYNKVLGCLDKYNNYATVKYIYTMVKVDDMVYFAVDADTDDPADFMEEYEFVEKDMLDAFEGKAVYNEEVTYDEWGAYYSAYAPVYDSKGNVTAIVGIDVDINEINAYLSRLRYMLIMSAFIVLLLIAALITIMYFDTMARDSVTELLGYERFSIEGKAIFNAGRLHKYTVVMVNIHDFKYFNKRYGYDIGNLILFKLGQYMRSNIKWPSKIARNGNDNFVLLIKNEQVESFLKAISDIELDIATGISENKIQIVVRCGVYQISEGDKFNTSMERCAIAINKARKESVYEPVYFTQDIYDKMEKESEILALYKNALIHNEFRVFYQPKVDPKTKRLCGAEALVRWFHEDKIISPGVFIPIIEREGLVSALDYHVLKLVCDDICKWVEMGLEPVRISTNFSKLHLLESDFASRVLRIIDGCYVEHKYLNVEMTESSGYTDMLALTEFLADMKNNNIYVSMDDFGTGYSSLSMLGDVEWDEIKIDKSLVDMIERSQEKATMVKNIIRIIHDLNRVVICEGVETKEQLEFLSQTECHMIQGYYFDKPLSEEDFRKRLLKPVYEAK